MLRFYLIKNKIKIREGKGCLPPSHPCSKRESNPRLLGVLSEKKGGLIFLDGVHGVGTHGCSLLQLYL